MRIANIQNKVISVLGMPHSGTTILSNTLNSMENGFCLSEPHWTFQTKPHRLTFDKVGKFHISSADDVLDSIRAKIKIDQRYDFGGVKETYRPQNVKISKYLDKIINESDMVLFIFREPKALMNNFKKLPIDHMPMARLLYDYNYLLKAANDCEGAIKVILEDYCDAGDKEAIRYLNSRCVGLLEIEGEFNLKPTNYRYGDPVANKSRHLRKANRGVALLSEKEKAIINKELLPKYQNIRNA